MAGVLVPVLAVLALSAASDRCQRSDTQSFSPTEILQKEDDFREGLGPDARRRLDAALPRAPDGRIAVCDGRDGSRCDAQAYMPALRETGLMPAFLATLCPRDREPFGLGDRATPTPPRSP
jgi:hypothetical protein